MLIRPATPADVPAVLPMVAAVCALHESWDTSKYGFVPNVEQRYQKWLIAQTNSDAPRGLPLRARRSIFLVAEDQAASGKLVAFLVATVEREIPIYRLQEFGFIHDLWVEPEYRHVGIAKQMVSLTIERFKLMGVKQIRLDTAAANDAARQLFDSCGFRLSTMEMLIKLDK